jgi:nitrate/nitrite transport system substrate-binding protein
MNRRRFLQSMGAAGVALPAARLLAACGGSESTAAAPSGSAASGPMRKLTLGFISLTDCAPLVIAKEKGIFAARGLDVTLENGKSWPGVRDKLASGEFAGAHALFSLPLSIGAGVSKVEIGGVPERPFRIAMMLNNNGQAITLASDLSAAGYNEPEQAAEAIRSAGAKQFGQTFPGGTHDTWLRYWMKAAGLDPKADGLDLKPIPPAEMFNNLNQENVRGYCVGEPWNARAVAKDKGFTTITTQDIWENHPEKSLVVNAKFAEEQPDTLRDLMGAVLEAQKWLDDPANVAETAQLIGVEKYVNATPDEIEARLAGEYDLGAGLGTKDFGDLRMRFFRDGQTPFPRRSHALWFLAQYQRFGLVPTVADPMGLVEELILTDVYAEVAAKEGVDVPDDDMKPFTVTIDDAEFDPTDLEAEVKRS